MSKYSAYGEDLYEPAYILTEESEKRILAKLEYIIQEMKSMDWNEVVKIRNEAHLIAIKKQEERRNR